MSDAILIQDLEFQWPGAPRPTLNIPHWQMAEGARVFLYGPSGSGKTTLLNLLAGIHTSGKGHVNILGQSLGALSSRARDRFRAQHMGYIFQQFNLVPYLSVQDNVALARHFGAAAGFASSTASRDLREETATLMRRLGLSQDLLTRKAADLSVGQQQRVAVVRALVNRPRLIIADEPSSALDSDTRDDFLALLLQCAAVNGSAVLFVSHDKAVAHHFQTSVALSSLNKAAGGA